MTDRKSLRDLARSLEQEEPSASPAVLAARMFNAIPEEQYGAYLRDALNALAITLSADARRAAFKNVVRTARGEGRADRVKMPRERVQVMIDPETNEEVRQEHPEYAEARSFKERLIRQEWEEFLNENLPTDNGYIFIREATVADLQRAADIRKSQGKALYAEAEKYANLATALEKSEKHVVGELTPADVRGML